MPLIHPPSCLPTGRVDFVVWQWIAHDEKDVDNLATLDVRSFGFSKGEVGDIIALVEKMCQLKTDSDVSEKTKKNLISTLSFWREIYNKIF